MHRAFLIALAGGTLLAGCVREAPETRDARRHAERYLQVLARGDLGSIRERSTCVVATESFRGGNVLKIDPPRALSFGALDSLAARAARFHRAVDSLWQGASEAEADSLFEASRRAGRTLIVYRNALRAATRSARGTQPAPDAPLEVRRLRVRTRYAGPLVGPKPVDREQILRMLRTSNGPWVVFSMYLVQDDPKPSAI